MRIRFASVAIAIIQLSALAATIDAREPTATTSKKHHKRGPKELVWNASRPEERILRYNVYEKIVDADQNTTWKKIATVHYPRCKIPHRGKGTHVFAVTAISAMGESQRSQELVIEN